jgi:ribonuclease-3
MFDFIIRPIRRRFGRDKSFYVAIDDMFGFIPHNIELYKLALIHKSASVELEDGRHINNERLEFLGDAVIESVTSDYLFIEYPDCDEGFMTQLRSKIVSRQSLNRIASEIGLDKYVISNAAGNVVHKHIYGDAFEAMMGAIYLDQGYDFVNRLLINDIFGRYLSLEDIQQSETDFKSRLIEWCQKNHYTIEFRTGHDHSGSSQHPAFASTVYIGGIAVGHGTGASKKEAEQNAAFSVSQSSSTAISDESSAKILDRLDKLAN